MTLRTIDLVRWHDAPTGSGGASVVLNIYNDSVELEDAAVHPSAITHIEGTPVRHIDGVRFVVREGDE